MKEKMAGIEQPEDIKKQDLKEKIDTIVPVNVAAADVIASLFNPDEEVCLRIFSDKKGDSFMGTKISVKAGKFSTIIPELEQHSQQNRGIFFAVNYGGQEDASITRINAQFVECDNLSFEEQQKQIDAFPLKPSLVIKTRKSLHVYWFIQKGNVGEFRSIQKRLVKHFGGDPACVNESRVLRLPGFNHCKEEPVKVEVISFHPELRYTQKELSAVLPEIEPVPTVVKEGDQRGLYVMMRSCEFIEHCIHEAATLSEPEWHAMISNFAVFQNGTALIHKYSQPYPGYDKEETQKKINHVLDSNAAPITCETIEERGFRCLKRAKGTCTCKSPAALRYQPLRIDLIQKLILKESLGGSVVENLEIAKKFIEKFLYNVGDVVAGGLINYDLKKRFDFKASDIRTLLAYYKKINKQYQGEERKQKSSADTPVWYEPADNGGMRFLPGILAEWMADEVPVIYVAGSFFLYKNGVYKPVDELMVENMVRENMLPRYTRLSQITDATGQLKMQVLKEFRELNTNPYIINVQNGLYNVLEDTLRAHSRDYLSTVQLQVNYRPDATCPRFIQYLHESVADDQIPLIQEMLGYFLIPVNHAQKAFVIVGRGSTGKSQLLLLINDILLGRENVSNVTWQALNERFKIAELFGKLANIFADLPSKNIDDNGIFKALMGEDFLTVEKKNKDPFSFQSYARMLFSCNSIPRNYGDKSEGFYRKLIIMRFDNVVPENKKDRHLQDKFRAEADGIFLFALEGLKRLLKNEFTFSETQSNIEELEKYREESNSVLSFVHEWCETDTAFETASMDLYNKYREYCDVCGLSPYAQKRFSQELENNFTNLKKGKDTLGQRRTWKGIRVRDSVD